MDHIQPRASTFQFPQPAQLFSQNDPRFPEVGNHQQSHQLRSQSLTFPLDQASDSQLSCLSSSTQKDWN